MCCAEASEKSPYPWNPPLCQPLQPKCHEQKGLGECGTVSTFSEAIQWLKRAVKVRGGEGGSERDDGE